jgi:hypothetical protein
MHKPRHPQQFLSVNGFSFLVTQRSGYIKANLDGQFGGWTSVWAQTPGELIRRITAAMWGSGQ